MSKGSGSSGASSLVWRCGEGDSSSMHDAGDGAHQEWRDLQYVFGQLLISALTNESLSASAVAVLLNCRVCRVYLKNPTYLSARWMWGAGE